MRSEIYILEENIWEPDYFLSVSVSVRSLDCTKTEFLKKISDTSDIMRFKIPV